MTTPGPAGDAPARPSRAGRDLPAAIGVGLALAGLILVSLLVRKEAFLVLLSIALCLAVWELRRALAQTGIDAPLVPVLIGTVAMILGAYLRGGQALAVTLGLTCVAVLLWRVADGLAGAARDICGGMLMALYPSFLAGFASLLLAAPDGAQRIITYIVVTAGSDVGGYAAGVLFGRHPMAPSVSPKKSWEGFAGSALACGVAGALCVRLLLHGPWWGGVLLGVLLAVAATVGDLMESTVKRDLGIKDMGTLLPGHGGLMDRLDSLLVAAPVCWGLLVLVIPMS